MRKPRITWKRTNDLGQTESHCGRYWLVDLTGPWSAEDETDNFRLWHADTCVIVGHYVHKADAKVAAENHLEGFAEEVRNLRHRVVDLEAAVEEHEEDWDSLTSRDAD